MFRPSVGVEAAFQERPLPEYSTRPLLSSPRTTRAATLVTIAEGLKPVFLTRFTCGAAGRERSSVNVNVVAAEMLWAASICRICPVLTPGRNR